MTKTPAKVLIVDDNEDVLLAAKLLLKPAVTTVHTEKNPENIPQLLKNDDYDVIFLDMNFTQDMTSGKEGLFWLNRILNLDPSAAVILITAFGDIELAVKAVKEGATDFVLKPWQNEKFISTLLSALRLKQSKSESGISERWNSVKGDGISGYDELLGVSSSMQKVFQTIEKVAATDANVLILGENGTGKELAARALHKNSKRSGRVFVRVDMGSLTPTLFESELFGHVKGAFTDAREDRAGRFETAEGGTLFLDEIGNIPIDLQAKLLTVLQNRQVARVGSNTYKSIDIRLICATNTPIRQLVAVNQFRQDLLYRINTVEIDIPPLRERKEDISLLADHFLRIYKLKYNKPELRLSPVTVKKLENYKWPGNVRELQHAIERSIILSESDILQPSDFFFTSPDTKEERFIFDTYNLEEVEKAVIRKVLDTNGGNVTKAAKELGLTRAALYRRMEKYNL